MVVARKAIGDCPKKVASLIDLANLPSMLREFAGQSQMSHLSFFIRVWSHIKSNNLQQLVVQVSGRHFIGIGFLVGLIVEKDLMIDNIFAPHGGLRTNRDPNNKNIVKCDDKLKSILLGKSQVELAELPMLIKLHFPKAPK